MNEEMNQPTVEPDIFTNRHYKVALTTAVILFLVMLTMTVLVIILASGRQEDREAEFNSTLTAVYDVMAVQTTALAQTLPNPALYPVNLAPGSPAYAAAASCDHYIISGTISDFDGAPTDAFDVIVWGDTVPYQHLNTGETAGLERGQWSLTLDNTHDRHVYIQLASGERYPSAPVVIALHANDCTQNAVTVEFIQVAPLE